MRTVLRALGLLIALPLAAQNVFTVDITGAVGFPTIQGAIDAAQDGDVVCIRTGTYTNGSFLVVDKALTIVAETGHAVTAVSTRIVNPNGKAVVLKGIHFRRNSPGVAGLNPGRNLHVVDNTGHVWIEDCTFSTGTPVIAAVGASLPAIEITNTTGAFGSFVMTRCDVRGNHAARLPTGVMQAGCARRSALHHGHGSVRHRCVTARVRGCLRQELADA